MGDGTEVAVLLFVLMVGAFGFGFATGHSYKRDAVRTEHCEQVCAPRPATHNDGKCFCLEAKP
jgi:hypothetical protein